MQGLGHIVGTDSNDRTRQSNAYTFVGCIGQKVENAAAVYDKFNATVFELSVLQGVHSITNPLRPIDDPDPQHVAQIKSTALQTKDNGVGFLSDRVAVMLRTGYRRAHVFQKIFGKSAAVVILSVAATILNSRGCYVNPGGYAPVHVLPRTL